MDAAKAVAMLATNEGGIEPYQMEGKPIAAPALPFFAVPTTSGTGSEATKVSVVYNPKNHLKKSFYDRSMIAQAVVLDPQLVVDLRRDVTVSTGVDALSHAIESYVSLDATPYTEMFSLQAMRLVCQSLETCAAHPHDLQARGDMMLASYFGGCALNAGIGLAHIIAQPLGGLIHIPHGVACAIYLPYAMRYNVEYSTAKYCDIARVFGASGETGLALAQEGIARVEALLTRLGAPNSIADYVDETFSIDAAVDAVRGATGHIACNPRPVTREAIYEGIRQPFGRELTITMGKKTKIASLGLNEAFWVGKSQQEMVEVALDKIESVRGYHPDLICLPEAFLKTGGDRNNPQWWSITQDLLAKLRKRAREMQCYILASVYEPSPVYEGLRYNCVWLIDRQGQDAGKYYKLHPVVEESLEGHVIPGDECPVFDTDFGRLGVQTCFDIGWRDGWKQLADQGAQLVVWSAAYDGGNLLNAYAALHMYYVVSTVRTNHARIIDLTGRTIAQGARWNGLAMATVDLETTLFHIDRQFQKIDQIRRALGDKVTIRAYSEENVFTIESNDAQWPMERIQKEFSLMTYKDYHAEASRLQEEWRAKYPRKR